MRAAAGGTDRGQGRASAAPVTAKLTLLVRSLGGMIGHGNAAGGTADRLSAIPTADKGIVAPSVEKQHRLILLGLIARQTLRQDRA